MIKPIENLTNFAKDILEASSTFRNFRRVQSFVEIQASNGNLIKKAGTSPSSRRNQFMIDLADEVVVGFASPGGNLGKILQKVNKPWKTI